MQKNGSQTEFSASARRDHVDYVVDMIEQLARMARGVGEVPMAIHLEAITAARRAIAPDPPEPKAGRRAVR